MNGGFQRRVPPRWPTRPGGDFREDDFERKHEANAGHEQHPFKSRLVRPNEPPDCRDDSRRHDEHRRRQDDARARCEQTDAGRDETAPPEAGPAAIPAVAGRERDQPAVDDGVYAEGHLTDQKDDNGETGQGDRQRKRGPATRETRKEPRGKRRTDGRDHAEYQ